ESVATVSEFLERGDSVGRRTRFARRGTPPASRHSRGGGNPVLARHGVGFRRRPRRASDGKIERDVRRNFIPSASRTARIGCLAAIITGAIRRLRASSAGGARRNTIPSYPPVANPRNPT